MFNTHLSAINWTPISEACYNGDVNIAYDLFVTHYKDAYSRAFPIILAKNKPRFKQPWMTKGLLKSSKRKAQLYLKYIKNPTLVNKSKFVTYRNKFKALRIQVERNYYAFEFNKNSTNL